MLNIKRFLNSLLARTYFLTRVYRFRHYGSLCVFMYHRVLPAKLIERTFYQPGMFVSLEAFTEQIEFLKRYYQIITFEQFYTLSKNNSWDPNQQYCVISFDDGWQDNYLYAYPILKKFGIPATIFLATDYIGTDKLFWPEELASIFESLEKKIGLSNCQVDILDLARKGGMKSQPLSKHLVGICQFKDNRNFNILVELLKAFPNELIFAFVDSVKLYYGLNKKCERLLLNWYEVSEMHKGGIVFYPHGCSHQILPLFSCNAIRKEMSKSRQKLLNRNISSGDVFCYPNGDYNQGVVHSAYELGYKMAVTTESGINRFEKPSYYKLKRIAVHLENSQFIPDFAFQLSGIQKIIKFWK